MTEELPTFCTYIKTDNSSTCQNLAIKGSIYCNLHIPNSSFICEGVKRDGTKCRAFKRKNSRFCRPEHDPDILRSTDPLDFRESNLRTDSRLSSLLLNQRCRDCYSDEMIKDWKKPMSKKQIDHYFELNLARDAYDCLRTKHVSEELDQLKVDVRHTFNQEFNLGLTDEKINQSKTSAIQNFANDYKTNSVNEEGLKFYLRNAPEIRTRGIVSKIINKVTTSVDLINEHFTTNVKDSTIKDNYLNEIEEMVKTWKLDS